MLSHLTRFPELPYEMSSVSILLQIRHTWWECTKLWVEALEFLLLQYFSLRIDSCCHFCDSFVWHFFLFLFTNDIFRSWTGWGLYFNKTGSSDVLSFSSLELLRALSRQNQSYASDTGFCWRDRWVREKRVQGQPLETWNMLSYFRDSWEEGYGCIFSLFSVNLFTQHLT